MAGSLLVAAIGARARGWAGFALREQDARHLDAE